MTNKTVNLNQKELQSVAGGGLKFHPISQALVLTALIGAYRSYGVYQEGGLKKVKGAKNIVSTCVSKVWQDSVFYGALLTLVGLGIG